MTSGRDSKELDLTRKGLGQILKDYTLKVPANQRSYKWEKDHVLDLFTDLQNAMDAESDEGDDGARGSDYFLGTIVLTLGERGILEVADGQQRLATTTILIAAIRDYLQRQGDNRHARIQRDYLIDSDLETEEPVPKLRLNVSDNGYFASRILAPAGSPERAAAERQELKKDSHKNLNTAALLAAEHVRNLVASRGREATAHLIKWVLFLRNMARVIVFVVRDQADAFVIFETLNDRGLELSKADLLKNYLFGRAGEQRFGDVQHQWTLMEGSLDTISEDDKAVTYIRHLWISEHGRTRDKELFKHIKDKIRTTKTAGDLSASLADNATRYVALVSPLHQALWNPYPPNTRDDVAIIKMMGWKQARPLMLAVVRKFTKKEVDTAFRSFVCWGVRYLIVGGLGSGSVEDNFADCAKRVTEGTISKADGILDFLAEHIPSDDEFETAFATARASRPTLARYYLHAMEARLRGDRCPESSNSDDPANITLEHVAPQNPEGGWMHIEEETYPSLVKRIGNLALLSGQDNHDSKSCEFRDKAAKYGKSSYALTQDLATYHGTNWGKEEIDRRQAKLAKIAVRTWPLKIGK